MDIRTENSFFRKLYIIVILLFLIIGTLFYLILSGGIDRIRPSNDPSVTPDTEPVHTDDPQPTGTPDSTVSPQPTETPESTESPEPTSSPEPSAEPEPSADITTDTSVTRIVNRKATIDPSYVPEGLIEPDVPAIADENQNLLREDAAHALEELFSAAADEGHILYLVSGYRSYEFQQKLWKYWVDQKGEAYASELDAWPGASEHQLGLAANVGTLDHNCELHVCFAGTDAYKWLCEHAYEYGFIERYPENKQDITGITYSPWNIRYVGKEEAEKLYKSGLTMEEYYGLAS